MESVHVVEIEVNRGWGSGIQDSWKLEKAQPCKDLNAAKKSLKETYGSPVELVRSGRGLHAEKFIDGVRTRIWVTKHKVFG